MPLFLHQNYKSNITTAAGLQVVQAFAIMIDMQFHQQDFSGKRSDLA